MGKVTRCPECGNVIALIFPLHDCKPMEDQMPQVIYRVMMLSTKTGRWEIWTNYGTYNEAELASRGLISGGDARKAHIWEITAGDKRIVAHVRSKPKPGWPHRYAAVKRT